ncbi:MAG: hypothetical protein ACK5LS_03975 [Propioniciclava sp.]
MGYFTDPVMTDAVATDCVRHGTSDVGPGHSLEPDRHLGAYNEIRWGQGEAAGCWEVTRSSGLGFAGSHSAEPQAGLIEIGRLSLTDGDTPEALRSVGLTTVVALADPVTSATERVTARFTIRMPTSGASAATAPAGVLPCLKQAVPDQCEAGLTLLTDPQNQPVRWGETSVLLQVAGWTRIGPDGRCDWTTLRRGAAMPRDGVATERCLVAEAMPADLTVMAIGPEAVTGELSITLERVDQVSGRPNGARVRWSCGPVPASCHWGPSVRGCTGSGSRTSPPDTWFRRCGARTTATTRWSTSMVRPMSTWTRAGMWSAPWRSLRRPGYGSPPRPDTSPMNRRW